MPSGKVAKPDITDNKDGTVTVKYAPTEAGLHEMDIKYDGIHIPGKRIKLVTCFFFQLHEQVYKTMKYFQNIFWANLFINCSKY